MSNTTKISEFLKKHNLIHKTEGENHKIQQCVFCNNEKFNLEIHITDGCFSCWACGESGSFKKFKSRVESTDSTDNQVPEPKKTKSKNMSVDLSEKALELHNDLPGNLTAEKYLKRRGFNQDSIDHFKLGVVKKGSELWLSIPHFQNEVAVNIKYRSMPPADKKWQQEKGSEKILFNSDILAQFNKIILTEGELKTIAVHQMGIKNVVGLTGGVSNIPPDWIDQLQTKERIYLCLDSDKAGQDAALKIAKQIGLNKCYNIVFEDAKDPDEYFFERKHSALNFRRLIKTAKQFDSHKCFDGLLRATDIEPETVRYLWEPYTPIGKISLMDGDPGVGKSHLALAVVSAISRGDHPWPEKIDYEVDSNNVLIFCGEDGAADTIIPRLKMLEANLETISIYHKPITFDENGLREIAAMIESQKPSLVLFDPMSAFMGGRVDINRANEVRERLSQLALIAEKHSCAILIVRHLNKGSKDHAIYRGLGSIDFAAVARSILMVGQHPTDDSIRTVFHVKSNLSKKGQAIQFRLENGVFSWAGKCELTIDDILYPNREAEQDKVERAKDFLLKRLADGPVNAKELKQEAAALGFSERTLERAKSAIDIKSRRVGGEGRIGSGYYEWFIEGHTNNIWNEVRQ